jgi:type IV pilus assembly protein PilB
MGREPTSSSAARVKDSIDHIISSAINSGVKTIHIEPSQNFILVRFRRGTKLEVVNKLPSSSGKEFSAQLKKLANLDFNKTSIPQYGLTKLQIAKKLHEFQVVTVPVIGGEKITIDVLNEAGPTGSLSSIGLWGSPLKQLQQALGDNHGLILITSPGIRPAQDMLGIMMGSVGSPSHLQAYIGPLINGLPSSVDIQNGDNVLQKLKLLPAGKHALVGIGLVGSSALARQINDQVIKKQHIMAVLPASSAFGALIFWQQMVNEQLSLPLVVNEHRVSSLCQSCKQDYEPPIIEQLQLASIFQVGDLDIMKAFHSLEISAIKAGLGGKAEASSTNKGIAKLWRPNKEGCADCNYSGFDGDIGVFEVLIPSDKLSSGLSHKTSKTELADIAREGGMVNLKTDALVKALRGLIDFKTLMAIGSTIN